MNPLRLIRTSTFQLAWWYMGIFGASALVLIGVLRWATVRYLEQQSSVAIEAELAGLAEQYRQRGPAALQSLVNARATIIQKHQNDQFRRNSYPSCKMQRWP